MSNIMSKFVDWMEPDAGRERILPSVLIPSGFYVCNPVKSDNNRHFVVGPFEDIYKVVEYLEQTTEFCPGEYITKVVPQALNLRAVDGCAVALNLLLNGLTGIDADFGTAVESLASLLHEDAIPASDVWQAILDGREFTIEGII